MRFLYFFIVIKIFRTTLFPIDNDVQFNHYCISIVIHDCLPTFNKFVDAFAIKIFGFWLEKFIQLGSYFHVIVGNFRKVAKIFESDQKRWTFFFLILALRGRALSGRKKSHFHESFCRVDIIFGCRNLHWHSDCSQKVQRKLCLCNTTLLVLVLFFWGGEGVSNH